MARVKEERHRGEEERKKIEEEKVRKKKMRVREKVLKSRNTVFFPMICSSGGSKSRLAKVAGAEPSGQMSDDKLRVAWRRSTFPSQCAKTDGLRPH